MIARLADLALAAAAHVITAVCDGLGIGADQDDPGDVWTLAEDLGVVHDISPAELARIEHRSACACTEAAAAARAAVVGEADLEAWALELRKVGLDGRDLA